MNMAIVALPFALVAVWAWWLLAVAPHARRRAAERAAASRAAVAEEEAWEARVWARGVAAQAAERAAAERAVCTPTRYEPMTARPVAQPTVQPGIPVTDWPVRKQTEVQP